MRSKTIPVFIAMIAFLLGSVTILVAGDEKQIKIPFPPVTALISANQCHCEPLVNTSVYADTVADKNIVGTLKKGGDKISVEITGDTLYFLSETSFNVGTTQPAEFQILYNTDESLLAVCTHKDHGLTVDIFTVNKKSGLAIWTKTRSNDLLSGGNPLSYSTYLICK